MKVIILPGNPPARYFYDLWAKELAAVADVEVEIAYPSFYPEIECSKEYFGTVTQDYAQRLNTHDPDQELLLIGHSLGAYYAMNALKVTQANVKKCVLLCPFGAYPHLMARMILRTMSFLQNKDRLRSFIINTRSWIRHFYPEVKYVEAEELHRCFHVVDHEHRALKWMTKGGFDFEQHADSGVDFSVYYTPKDMWCSEKILKSWEGSFAKHKLETIRHDFVVIEEQRKLVSQKLLDLI